MAWCPHCKEYYDEDNDTQPCCPGCGHPIYCCNGSYEDYTETSEEYEDDIIGFDITQPNEMRLSVLSSNNSQSVIIKQYKSNELTGVLILSKGDIDKINTVLNSSRIKNKNRIDEIKDQYKKAYQKWNPQEENLLRLLFNDKLSIEDISSRLQRQPSAIRGRLIKLGLIKE